MNNWRIIINKLFPMISIVNYFHQNCSICSSVFQRERGRERVGEREREKNSEREREKWQQNNLNSFHSNSFLLQSVIISNFWTLFLTSLLFHLPILFYSLPFIKYRNQMGEEITITLIKHWKKANKQIIRKNVLFLCNRNVCHLLARVEVALFLSLSLLSIEQIICALRIDSQCLAGWWSGLDWSGVEGSGTNVQILMEWSSQVVVVVVVVVKGGGQSILLEVAATTTIITIPGYWCVGCRHTWYDDLRYRW